MSRIKYGFINNVVKILLFFLIIYGTFFCAVCVGGAFQQSFELISRTLFIDIPAWLLINYSAPNWLQCIVVHGIGRGINITLTFIPVLTGMFFSLAILESSKYITRIALVMNRLMCYLGLPGQSFMPMLLGFGCNVSAIVGTKILSNSKERILTMLMIPFISCGARLAVYAMFVAAFFPYTGQNIVFLLYIIGILVAIFTGFVFRETKYKHENCFNEQNLPQLKVPKISIVFLATWQHLKLFLIKIGSIIIPFCIVIGMLEHIKINQQTTILEMVGKKVTPIFAPMGIQQDNWPAVVALMTGVISKEVIIGTLTTLYQQEPKLLAKQEHLLLKEQINIKKIIYAKITLAWQQAYSSIKINFIKLRHTFFQPLTMSLTNNDLDDKILGTLWTKFQSTSAAFAYLLFILLYCPCLSVLLTIARELGVKWALFSMVWTTSLAYIIAITFYHIFTISILSKIIICVITASIAMTIFTYLIKFLYKSMIPKTKLIATRLI